MSIKAIKQFLEYDRRKGIFFSVLVGIYSIYILFPFIYITFMDYLCRRDFTQEECLIRVSVTDLPNGLMPEGNNVSVIGVFLLYFFSCFTIFAWDKIRNKKTAK